MHENRYDILIVGAGVAGSALAHALSTITSKLRGSTIRVALLERSLSEPNRIVGEVLQRGGIAALEKLGMADAVKGIDSIPERGICFARSGRLIRASFPDGQHGVTFHHGRFVMRLRDYAKRAAGVDVIEATVNELIECERTKRVLGVRATRTTSDGAKESFFADLVIMADGGRSNFRNAILGKSVRPTYTPNHAFGTILKDVQLPIPEHTAVFPIVGQSAVAIMFQTSKHDTRFVLNINHPPSNVKEYILTTVIPYIPESLHSAIREALDREGLRRMPNSSMPSVVQGGKHIKKGVFLLGDSWQMRHPCAGGGMTVALNDVVLLADMLGSVENLGNWDQISDVLGRWYWARKPLATSMTLVSFVSDALACAGDEYMMLLMNALLAYLEHSSDPDFMSLVSGVPSSSALLSYQFYKVSVSVIWMMIAGFQPVTHSKGEGKIAFSFSSVTQYPSLLVQCVKMFWTVCIAFAPVVWSELRWW